MKRLNFPYGMQGRKQFGKLKIWYMAALQSRAELTIPLVRDIKGNSSTFLMVTFSTSYEHSTKNSEIVLKYVTK